MKKKEIPQDKSSLEGKDMREIYYVEDDDGNYSTGLSTGWNPKKVALDLTLERIEEQLKSIIEEIKVYHKSPIYYFMIKCRMDVAVLSSYMKQSRWKTKRHLKYNVFQKLSSSQLEKYATIFDIDVNQLTNFNE